jgi:hypothetical protein
LDDTEGRVSLFTLAGDILQDAPSARPPAGKPAGGFVLTSAADCGGVAVSVRQHRFAISVPAINRGRQPTENQVPIFGYRVRVMPLRERSAELPEVGTFS